MCIVSIVFYVGMAVSLVFIANLWKAQQHLSNPRFNCSWAKKQCPKMRFICEPPNDQQNENIAYFFHLNRFEIQSKRVHSANRMRTNAWNRFRKVSLKWPFTQQLRSLPRQQRALSLFCLFNLRQQQNQNVRMVACYFVVGLFWLLSASCRRATRQTHSNQQFIAIWISTLHMYGMMFIFGLFFFSFPLYFASLLAFCSSRTFACSQK